MIGEPGYLPDGMPTEAIVRRKLTARDAEQPDSARAGNGSPRTAGEPACPLQSEFHLGPVGLGSDAQTSQNDTWSRLAGMPEEVPPPRTAAKAQPLNLQRTEPPTARAAVQAAATGAQPTAAPAASRASRANLQQPRSVKAYEPNPNQSTDSTAGAAANH